MARADTLEDELRELRQAPPTASLDADYDRRFMKASKRPKRRSPSWRTTTTLLPPRKDATPPVPNEYHALKKLTSMRQRQIGHYLQLFYPLPQQLAHSSACNYLAVSEIFDRLLEASANRSEERYIELSVEFWPPHVQVLLNANLVERHPHDSNRIRLRDWG
ncbi:hypothetical protein MTO96_033710 [Rhipicephalus appendiculatus]